MAEYVFSDVGLNYKLAFDLEFVNKVVHCYDPLYSQLKETSFDLVQIFGGERGRDEFSVVLLLNDGSSFLVNNCQFVKSSDEIKIYPLHPSLFEEGREWARAVLSYKNEVAFSVDKENLEKVCNG